MQRSSTSLPALAQQQAHLTLVQVAQESIPVKKGADRVHPPYVLSVLVLVGEDRWGVQDFDVPHVAHEGEVLEVDPVVP
jgi:hypothetical protein